LVVLPPGTLLQLMYLGERLDGIQPGRFIEVGPGSGEITNTLLKAGWTGIVYDLSEETIEKLGERLAGALRDRRLVAVKGDFLSAPVPSQPEAGVDLVISCMVMEHLDDDAEVRFLRHAASHLKMGGRMIGLVPASRCHWGIEDDIAGHYRRYDKDSLHELFRKTGWKPVHVAGLTYPISNLLLPFSNFLVRKHEANKLTLSLAERTEQSGRRNVLFKTTFPAVLSLFLNQVSLLPFHWIQKIFSNSPNALVIYFEAVPEP